VRRKKLLISVTGAAAGIVLSAGIAAAVWSASGSGNAGAAATVAQGLTVTAVTPTGANANLYPGGPAGSVAFSVANPNPYAVTITGFAWGTPSSNTTSTCPNTNISVDTNAPKTPNISIPANDTAGLTIVEPGVLDLAHSAPDGCQGATFNVPLTITGIQQ
jgi:hypothetical protein